MFDVTTLWAIPSQGWTFGVSPPGRRNRGVPIFEFAIASFARNRLVSSVVVPRQQRVGFTEAAEGLHTPRVWPHPLRAQVVVAGALGAAVGVSGTVAGALGAAVRPSGAVADDSIPAVWAPGTLPVPVVGLGAW